MERCGRAGVRPSTGKAGDCYANSMYKSLFATLECELSHRSSFASQVAARKAIFDFIERWHNPHRGHSGLDYSSPIDFERRHPDAQQAA